MFSTLPVRHHLIEEFKERHTVMWLGHMTEFMRNYVVDGINRSLYQPTVEQQATCWRHGTPSLPGLTDNEALGSECVRCQEKSKTTLKPLQKCDLSLLSVPILHQIARHLGPVWTMRLHDNKPSGQIHALSGMRG